ncbi:MAG: dihydrofolate reductase [Prevotella sp.]|nr:dihydrofolate reductase [Prevotella sp.]
MIISIIAAVAKNRAIGYKNKLLYSIGDDMKRFKALTTGHTVIMGRKTFESLPFGALPNRRNIVISNSKKHIDGCECMNSINDAIHSCKNEDEIFIIGGGKIYDEAIHIADKLYITEIDDCPTNADTFFPDYNEWKCVSTEEHKKSECNHYAFTFKIFFKSNFNLK